MLITQHTPILREVAVTVKHPFAELIGLHVEPRDDGSSFCSLDVSADLLNPQDVVHGAVVYALADTGMGAALYPLVDSGNYIATIEVKISYFKAVYEGLLECETKLINKGKSIASLESTITNGDNLVAKASGTYSIFKPRKQT